MRFLFVFLSVILPFSLTAQITIKGVVLDEDYQEPVIGTNIKIKNSSRGTITDINGEFEITIPNLGDTLVISFVGYESQEVVINDILPIQIFLKEPEYTSHTGVSFFLTEIKYWGGVLNTPYGLKGTVSIQPYSYRTYEKFNSFHSPILSLDLTFGYQTNFLQNQQVFLASSLRLPQFKYPLINFSYRKINREVNFTFESIQVAKKFSVKSPLIGYLEASPIIGYSYLDTPELLDNYWGFGGLIEIPFWIHYHNFRISVSTVYWQKFWEFRTNLNWYYRRYSVGIEYEKIQNFEEVQLYFGRSF